MSAVISDCRTYRYELAREIAPLTGVGTVTFIGLNPSTAGETTDDPTVRRCIGFARSWGFALMKMLNIYAYRATDPRELGRVPDPVGPDNFVTIERVVTDSDLVVCAWGVIAPVAATEVVLDLIAAPHCLGITKHGQPRHPLYVLRTQKPMPFAHCPREAAWTP